MLDRKEAGAAIVAALASLSRGASGDLPMRADRPRVTGANLAAALAQARTAVSAPVVLTLGPTRYRIPRWRIATLLKLPANGATRLRIGGPAADAFFKAKQKVVDTPAHDAQFVVTTNGIRVQPSKDAQVLDVPKTVDALLAAASRPANRTAQIAVATQAPERTTQDALAMGINGLYSSYTTYYGGVPNRIHNVQVVSHLVDNTLIPPGKEFSFNGTTGERNAAKGLLEAPVIINGELQNGLGGGTCQVSTTVFNAAYEGGLPITARTNHALYISHYPQGRDATVNYPDTDLKFVNDTGHWLLLRTFVSSSSLTVNLYGTPQHRKVVSETSPLVTTGAGAAGDHEGPEPARRREGGRPAGIAAALDQRQPQGLRREGQAALRQHVVLELRRREDRDPRRDEAEAQAEAQAEGGCDDDADRAGDYLPTDLAPGLDGAGRHDGRHHHPRRRPPRPSLPRRRPPRPARRESAWGAASPGRRRRAASTRPRPPRRRGSARTRT